MFLATGTDGSIVIVEGSGEVAEWLKAPVSKTGICIRISRVRIPPSSPNNRRCWPVAGRYRQPVHPLVGPASCGRGEVPERLNGHAWKACVGASSPQVRILSSPPFLLAISPGRSPGAAVLGHSHKGTLTTVFCDRLCRCHLPATGFFIWPVTRLLATCRRNGPLFPA